MPALIVCCVVIVIGLIMVKFATSPDVARVGVILTTVGIIVAALVSLFLLVRSASAKPAQPEMPIKLIATLCRLNFPADCHDEMVTTSISMTECMVAVRGLPQWSEQFPAYYVAAWKCQIGVKATEREA